MAALNEFDKKKLLKKKYIAKKKEEQALSEKASEIAAKGRKKRNIECIQDCMALALSEDFVTKLNRLLEEEGSDMASFHDLLDSMEPYQETVSVVNANG